LKNSVTITTQIKR